MIHLKHVKGLPCNFKGNLYKNSALKPNDNFVLSGRGNINHWKFKENQVSFQSKHVKNFGGKLYCERSILPLANLSNVSIHEINGKLYTAGEMARMLEFNRETLEFESLSEFGTTNAHGISNTSCFYTFRNFLKYIQIVDINDSNEVTEHTVNLESEHYAHDMCEENENIYFVLNPYKFDIFSSFTGKLSVVESMDFTQNGTSLLIYNKKTQMHKIVRLPIDNVVFHHKVIDDKLFICCLKNDFDFLDIKPDEYNNLCYEILLSDTYEILNINLLPFKGDMPVRINSSLLFINSHTLYCYDTLSKTYEHIEFQGIIEEPTIVNNIILINEHLTNKTKLHMIDDDMEVISTYELNQSICHGFHGLFVANHSQPKLT